VGIVAFAFIGAGAVGVRGDEFRVLLDRNIEIGDGLVVLLLAQEPETAVTIVDGEIGIDANRLGPFGDRTVVVVLGKIRAATVVVGVDISGIEPDRLIAWSRSRMARSYSPFSSRARPRLR